MSSILYVIRPICIGLMLSVMYSMGYTTYWLHTETSKNAFPVWLLSPDWSGILIGLLSFYLLLRRKNGVIFVIIVAAICGLILT